MTQPKYLSDMQQEVDDYISQFKAGYFSPLAQLARLTEETGELAREINHYYGEKAKKTDEIPKTVEEELGDVLVVLLIMANSLDIDLTKVFEDNMKKFYARDSHRFERVDEEKSMN
ncbi:nucleotide pyrophosphohydrolase [Vagococcus martis]|uniref:Nucleotide pyrophosphohydrolase n=1 Tax=Vagococcus martis TaxID=1768210 RepID=A0A1V4DE68_9ENTE|nr:nucleotide pyrophosphohydrolase [Vagococcus martis]OPF86854.1 nucleotide pyrophosphohydrolase [Vagococcus martis]